MNKIFCLSLILLFALGCGSSENPNIHPDIYTTDPNNSYTVTIPSGAHSLGSAAFGSNPLNVHPGAAVTWLNSDSMAHTVTADDRSWDSGSILPGGRYTRFFPLSGTFNYHCSIHPSMTGSIQSN